MPTAPLPENPSLEHLKGQAKLVRDLVRAGDEGALGMIDEFHPRLTAVSVGEADRVRFKTTDAQLIVARMYGFASWPALRTHLDIIREHSFTPQPEDADLSRADEFVVAACVDYAEHGPRPEVRLAAAQRMLADSPSLARGSIAALATVGDHEGLRTALADDPDAVNRPSGPNHWPPLLYAVYSRLYTHNPAWSALETVKVLLDAGADPNAGFFWRGLVPPFTALTGALGGAENHHPDRLELARLLLEAGADPNDGQGLYNNGIGGENDDDPAHLQLLVEFGLGMRSHGPWYEGLGDRLREPTELLYDELEAATKRSRPNVLRYLLSLGLDPGRPVGRSQLAPVRIAAADGHEEILDVLAEHDIDVALTPTELVLHHSRSNDVRALNRLLGEHPDLLGTLQRDFPGLCNNVSADHESMLSRLFDLGFDINDRSTTKTPLHHAAEAGDTDRARLLLDHGADPNLTDTHIHATPWGWANHCGHTDTAELLHPLTHHGDSLPEIAITSPTSTRTLATHRLIEAHLDQIRQQGKPQLTTLRHHKTALTVGLGHPDVSVVLYLDADGTPWHALSDDPPEPDPDIEWAAAAGAMSFHPRAKVDPAVAWAVAAEYLDNPTTRPDSVRWEIETAE